MRYEIYLAKGKKNLEYSYFGIFLQINIILI